MSELLDEPLSRPV